MNHKYLPLIAAIFGIILLYSISLISQPIIISIDQIGDYEGKTVTIQGKVIDYYLNNHDNQMISIQQNNASTLLFLESPIEIQKGDEIQVTGKVQKYEENWELIIETLDNIFIVNKWENNAINLKNIAINPTYYKNQNLNVTGYIDLIFDDYFHFKDDDQKYTFFVKKPYNLNTSIYPGKKVMIKAYFKYDTEQTRYIFELNDKNHSISPIMEN